jgi:adenine-specific DNA methylase
VPLHNPRNLKELQICGVEDGPKYLEVGRGLVKAAHPEETPLVVDPFAGGGSIPLEALRLGCDTFASDLNPVACLILKVMLEDIPRHGLKLAEELRRVGAEIKEKAEKELAEFYPKDPDLPAPRRGKFFIYVLQCSDNSFYIGQTEDIPRRLKQHEDGEVSWTSKHLPVKIIHWEEFDSREAAVKREQDLKTGFGRKWLKREYKAGRLAARQAGGAKPIAYLWARTVRCEAPNCGAEIPVFRSAWLSKRSARRAQYFKEDENGICAVILIDDAPLGGPIRFRIARGHGSEEQRPGYIRPACTKALGNNANVICPCCKTVLPGNKKNPRVALQLAAQSGGGDVTFDEHGNRVGGSMLLAVVTMRSGEKRRIYRLPSANDYRVVWKAKQKLHNVVADKAPNELSFIPNEGFHSVRPSPNSRGLSAVTRYGMTTFASLYTSRQLLSLGTMTKLVRSCKFSQPEDRIAHALRELLALTISRVADYCSAQSRWDSTQERNVNSFGRQALPMLWDFAELVPFADCVGSLDSMLNSILRVVRRQGQDGHSGQVQCGDATQHPLPTESTPLWFTDPPYYDSVPYADLADFFYVWLKRMLMDEPLVTSQFENGNQLTPKSKECVWNRAYKVDGKEKDPAFFEDCVARSFAEGRRITQEQGLGCVVFAHKTTEGWEALLSGLARAGWIVAGSWPIATEQRQRLVARESAALATSVHLVCRPRPKDAPVGDWGEVVKELPNRVGSWVERLQNEGVRGADLVFACIGPALEIYSKFSKVEDAQGREIPLGGDPEAVEPHKRGFLAYVWETVGRVALEQVLGTAEAQARNSAAGALEEDARLTALFLWTLQSTNSNGPTREHGEAEEPQEIEEDVNEEEEPPKVKPKGFSLIFDVVRRFAQPLGIRLPDWEGRIIETKKGVVRLLSVSERTKQLFGEAGASAIADRLEEQQKVSPQMMLFPEFEQAPTIKGRRRKAVSGVSEQDLQTRREATTLDRVHAAMLLQASGRANALRALIKAEQERGPDFLRLANALSALYPKNSEEKRLIDAMLLAVPR